MPHTGPLPYGMNSFVGNSNQFINNSIQPQYQNIDSQMMQMHPQFMNQSSQQILGCPNYSTLINSPQSSFQLQSSISQPNALNMMHQVLIFFNKFNFF